MSEITHYTPDWSEWTNRAVAMINERGKRIEELEARVAKLEEALRPFADEAYRYDPDEDDDNQTAYNTYIKIGQLRAARRALEEK